MRHLPNHRRGIPRADGRLPSSVTKANIMLDNAIEIMGAALERGALGGFESPVSRGAGSAFSIEGREDHASMWHDPELIKFHKKYLMTGVAFDQCRTTEAGTGRPSPRKTTFLSGTPTFAKALRQRFGSLVCNHRGEHEPVAGEAREDDTFVSEATAEYSPAMNELIADSVLEAMASNVTVAAADVAADPLSDWGALYDEHVLNTANAVFMEDEPKGIAAVLSLSRPRRFGGALLSAMLALCLPLTYRPNFYETGIDHTVMAMPREDFEGDNPSFHGAMKSRERTSWQGSMDREMFKFDSHNVYLEVPEDSLASWDSRKRRSSEVLDTLWVLRRKRDGNNKLIEGDDGYRGRCVVNGSRQKAKAAARGVELQTFMPTTRTATHKLQCAHCCATGRRKWQFDISSAYLLGTFEAGETVHVRPPRRSRGLRVS